MPEKSSGCGISFRARIIKVLRGIFFQHVRKFFTFTIMVLRVEYFSAL